MGHVMLTKIIWTLRSSEELNISLQSNPLKFK